MPRSFWICWPLILLGRSPIPTGSSNTFHFFPLQSLYDSRKSESKLQRRVTWSSTGSVTGSPFPLRHSPTFFHGDQWWSPCQHPHHFSLLPPSPASGLCSPSPESLGLLLSTLPSFLCCFCVPRIIFTSSVISHLLCIHGFQCKHCLSCRFSWHKRRSPTEFFGSLSPHMSGNAAVFCMSVYMKKANGLPLSGGCTAARQGPCPGHHSVPAPAPSLLSACWALGSLPDEDASECPVTPPCAHLCIDAECDNTAFHADVVHNMLDEGAPPVTSWHYTVIFCFPKKNPCISIWCNLCYCSLANFLKELSVFSVSDILDWWLHFCSNFFPFYLVHSDKSPQR